MFPLFRVLFCGGSISCSYPSFAASLALSKISDVRCCTSPHKSPLVRGWWYIMQCQSLTRGNLWVLHFHKLRVPLASQVDEMRPVHGIFGVIPGSGDTWKYIYGPESKSSSDERKKEKINHDYCLPFLQCIRVLDLDRTCQYLPVFSPRYMRDGQSRVKSSAPSRAFRKVSSMISALPQARERRTISVLRVKTQILLWSPTGLRIASG